MSDRVVLAGSQESQRVQVPIKSDNQKDLAKARGDAMTKSGFVEVSTLTARNLLKIKTNFPLDPWPDYLVVDEIKVSVILCRPFGSEVVQTLLIKDITDVMVSSTPFAAAIQITGGDFKGFPGEKTSQQNVAKGPLFLKALKKNEAARARRIIMGLIIMSNQKVDTSKLPLEILTQQAEELGRAR